MNQIRYCSSRIWYSCNVHNNVRFQCWLVHRLSHKIHAYFSSSHFHFSRKRWLLKSSPPFLRLFTPICYLFCSFCFSCPFSLSFLFWFQPQPLLPFWLVSRQMQTHNNHQHFQSPTHQDHVLCNTFRF